ncbi:hypothetical protein [Hymenobacter perfusus]|uniref:Beta-lactamase-inhibitor-like PepSY-like domain-containing protein n=1 Tax=Hymenobacter perfusus TaxID=1236770 RepID=A0A428KHA0_9BACT|nr:hypothetical protein [Hymenobacter perfusus]RSK45832.1 hypothetical protein EI293_01255 [Hymenobacter perfusus]
MDILNMKRIVALLFCCALTSHLYAQTYLAKNAMRTREIPVPKNVVKKFKRTYPNAHIDSCYVYGNVEAKEEHYMFYSRQQNRVLNVAFDRHCAFTESKTEISIEELPIALQKTISQNSFHAESIGKVFKLVGSRRKNEIEYLVECFTNYQGNQLKIPMYFNAAGFGANPGFR